MNTITRQMPILQLRRALESGVLTVQALAETVIRKQQQWENLGAIWGFDADHVRQAALNVASGKLSGIPFVAKDNINTTSFATSGGTPALSAHIPETNAPALQRLLDQGAVLVGKAAMHELAFGITSNNAATGPVRNPHDFDRIPGGSSGGTAAAVAAGIVPFGLGTDTGGSCRIPAALCGVVGFRPSTGRYPGTGVMPISHTRDTIGPIAHWVEDIQWLDAILAQQEFDSSTADVRNLVLGRPAEVVCDDLEPAVAEAFSSALSRLKDAGAEILPVSISEIWSHNEAFSFPVVLYEVVRDLSAYLEQHAPGVSIEALFAGIESADVRDVLLSQLGEQAITEARYKEALEVHRPQMREIYAKAFAEYGLDAMIFPTTPLRAANIGEDETVTLNGSTVPTFPTYIRNTDLGSNLGAPGISLPCRSHGSLPVGVEIDGAVGADTHLLSVARAIETIIN